MKSYGEAHLYPNGKRELAFVVSGLLLALISLGLDFLEVEGGWFQRSGALLVLLGAVCEARYVQKVIAEDVVANGSAF